MNKEVNIRSIFSFLLLSLFIFSLNVNCEENEEAENVSEEQTIEIVYFTPKTPPNALLFESFDDISSFEEKWIKSKAKKDDVDENIAKYDGVWSVEALEKDALNGDRGLVLKSKAKHAAISARLGRPFIFKEKPFVIQYEVNLQNGQDCGGAYIKLLSNTNNGLDLNNFNDKTPYTIMFGPDKCGNEHKLHFIFRHVNPLNKEIEEKHCKKPRDKIEAPFKDKVTHLYTLILRPDNSYEILLDHEVINSGNLLEDFTPSVNPPKEISDPNDVKPSDWDEREKIPDPISKKPDDWDEDAPRQIVDHFAVKPDDWLEDVPDHIPDPDAVKPDDWDNDMDGEWEAPLVPNPICEGVSGCGKWNPPLIDNPNYKGKWKPDMINNPNYKGKWAPRKISNPDYFEDLEPFKMTSIGAVGLELWSMSDGIYFDNILVTDNIEEARQVAMETYDLKMAKLQKEQKSYLTQTIEFSNQNPWIYGVYVLLVAIPVVLIFVCCCADDSKDDKVAIRKKTDEPAEDDDEVKDEEKDDVQEDDVQEDDVQEDDVQEDDVQENDVQENNVQDDDVQDDDVQDDDVKEDDVKEEEVKETEEQKKDETEAEEMKVGREEEVEAGGGQDEENEGREEDVEAAGGGEEEQHEETQASKSGETEKSDDETRKSPRLRKVRKE